MGKLLQQLGTPDYPHNPAENRQGEPLNGVQGQRPCQGQRPWQGPGCPRILSWQSPQATEMNLHMALASLNENSVNKYTE